MTEPFSDEFNATASWFLGPRAENGSLVKEFYDEIIRLQIDGRRKYYPGDKDFITSEVQESRVFKENMKKMKNLLFPLLEQLSDKSMPFWSPRYMGHMSMEQTLASNLGFVAALQFNQNNIAVEGSPFTTSIEIEVGLQLCKMFGFNVNDDGEGPKGWGHLTSGGSVSNLESIWASRNLKFYPLTLRLAIEEGQLSFIASSFKVELANGHVRKLLKDCTTWELLNLKSNTILDIPQRLYQIGISPQFLETALNKYSIQTVGKDYLERKFGIKKPALYLTSSTKHYSFPKGCAITGIGSENLIDVPVDNMMRMDVKELEMILEKCVQNRQAVYAIAAIMGTTEHGACDPLADIVKLRNRFQRKYGLSFVVHADGAWGGYFCSTITKPQKTLNSSTSHRKSFDGFVPKLALSPYTEKHLRSIKDSDSITVDPHKSGYAPYPAGALCYRDQRMKYLVTWKVPVVVRPGEESIGVYGVAGSKPGAPSVSVWLSHSLIGLHQRGYGTILGQAIFSCSKMYCHWATMSNDQDDFIVTPLVMLPSEKRNLSIEEVKKEKEKIHDLIVTKSNQDIVNNKEALELIKIVGSDLVINTFACNFKINGVVNKDIIEANHLNKRLFESFTIRANESNKDKPLILTSSVFKQSDYGKSLKNFKDRLGLKGDQDLYVLINVVMSPWTTKFDFMTELASTFKNTLKELVKDSISRNTDVEDYHDFVMKGTDKAYVYLTNRPMFRFESHRHQVIVKVKIDKMNEYKQLRKKNPSKVLFLRNNDKAKLDRITCRNTSFKANIYEKDEPLILDVQVTIIELLKKRRLGSLYQDTEYPKDHVPFYLYGTKKQLHIDHMLLKYPSIQLSADNVQLLKLSGKFTERQKEKGVIAHITNFYEIAMQPVQQGLPDSFFFKANKTYNVKLYEDPMHDPTRDGPGLNNVARKPFAIGKIKLPSSIEGSLFIDSNMINSDSVKPRLEP